MLIGHLYIFFGEMSIQGFCHLKKNQIVFLLVSFSSSPYIVDINPLSDIWFINTFSHSVGCLFRGRKWNSVCQGLGGEKNRELLFNGYRVLSLQDRQFWRWTVVIVVQQDEYTSYHWTVHLEVVHIVNVGTFSQKKIGRKNSPGKAYGWENENLTCDKVIKVKQ